MKYKILGIIAIIITIFVVSVTQSMQTSELESVSLGTTNVESVSINTPEPSTQPSISPVPSIQPEASESPEPSNTVAPTATPTSTQTPVPTESVAPIKREGINTSSSSVNIREKASTDSTIVGKLHSGAIVTITKEENGWFYISSGKVNGYVSSNLITTSDNMDELKKKYQTRYAVVKVDKLNARSKASSDATIITKLEKGSQHKVLSITDEWVQIALYNTTMIGYVSKDYVGVNTKVLTALSSEEERAAIQATEKKLMELENQQQQSSSNTNNQGSNTVPKPTATPSPTPKPTKTTAPTKTPVSTKTPAPTKTTAPTKTPTPDNSVGSSLTNSKADQIKLLACIIYCESASESYDGKLAVANVILNRVKSSRYPNTIKEVVYQKNQFSPASSGRLETHLKRYASFSTKNELDSIKAAKDALSGNNNIENRMRFRSSYAVSVEDIENAIQIGTHVFW